MVSFKSICRSGANLEKVLCIRGGAMQVYHHNVSLLLVIYCCYKASNRIVTRSKELVFYSWIPLSPEVSRLSPYTHMHNHIR